MPFVPKMLEAAEIVAEAVAQKGLPGSFSAAIKLGEEVIALNAPKAAGKILPFESEGIGLNISARLYPEELKTLKLLSEQFAHEPAAEKRLAQLSPAFHRSVVNFIKDGARDKIDFVSRELVNTASDKVLDRPMRLSSLFELEGKTDQATIKYIRELEVEHPSVPGSVSFILRTQEGGDLVAKLAANGSPAAHFDSQRLSALMNLQSRFGVSSPVTAGLLKLEAKFGLTLWRAAAIPDDQYLKKLIETSDVDTIKALTDDQTLFLKLAKSMVGKSDAIEKVGQLTIAGQLDVKSLNGFINGEPFKADVAASEIMRGAPPIVLNGRHWLPGVSLVTKHLGEDSETMKDLLDYGEKNSRGLWKIGSYLDGAPEERAEAVRRMARAGTLDDPQGLTRLTMFPQKVAEKIATGAQPNGYRIENIIGNAREFESGANFVSTVSDYLHKHENISRELLEQFHQEAKDSSEVSSAFVAREASPLRSASTFCGSNSYTVGSLAADIKESTRIILDKFAPERTLVVLARDMNPFTSILRASGRTTINFPFSRSQISDPATAAHWLSEVPPNAVVVDSKLNGTVLDAIKRIDPTIEGYMLQSRSSYPALLPRWPLGQVADDIEVFPKITGRSTGFTQSGAALSRLKNADQEDYTRPGVLAINTNRALLQELGLSDWNVWRYQAFTGMTQSERLALTQPEHINLHLETVAGLRSTRTSN